MPHPLDEVVLSRIVAAEASRDPDRLLYVFENAPHPAVPVAARALAPVADPAEPWLLLPTSGPTGEPVLLEVPWARMSLLRAVPEALGYRSDDVVYTGLALTECNAIALALVPSLVGAADRSVISRRFTKSRLWRIWIECGVSTWAIVADVARAIYALPGSEEDGSHAGRLVTSCGMPPQIWRAFEAR